MRTAIFSFALISFSFFLFANQASAQMIVSDSTKTPGIQLVNQEEGGDPILIVYNLHFMNLEQLEAASEQIEDDIQQTETMIRVLGKCNECNQDLDVQVERNKKSEKLLIMVDLEIQKRMDLASKN